jgi:hypothetical protein
MASLKGTKTEEKLLCAACLHPQAFFEISEQNY